MTTVNLRGNFYKMPSAAPQAEAVALLRRQHLMRFRGGLVGSTQHPYDAYINRERNGQISGTVKVSDVPAYRRVTLLDHRSLHPVAACWSDPETGAYTFTGLDTGRKYLVVCDDYTQTYNAAVADWVAAEAAP